MDRKLTTHLLILADNDDFFTTLHILLTTHPSHLNLNRRTISGDYLITLATYTICEKSIDIQSRMCALKCLHWILDHDFTAAHKIAGDGGSALHCALAAASCLYDECDTDDANIKLDHYDDDEEDEVEDESEDEYEDDEDDDEEGKDKKYLKTLISRAHDEVSIVNEYCQEFKDISSHGMILITLQLLLSYEADVNLPLANVYGIKSKPSGNEEDDEFELAYSRESIIAQWTPLMFALQYIILASKEVKGCDNQTLILPILIVLLLLDSGADPTYLMTGECSEDNEWNALHILAASSHVLSKITFDLGYVENIERMLKVSNDILTKIGKDTQYGLVVTDNEKDVSLYHYLRLKIVQKISVDDNNLLTTIQSFILAIMTNDASSAIEILKTSSISEECDDIDLLRKWRSVKYQDVLPQLRVEWDDKTPSTTILDIAASCHAIDCLRLLIGDDLVALTEEEMRRSIKSSFEGVNEDGVLLSLQILLGMEEQVANQVDNNDGICNKRQRVLDRLLMESCTRASWAQKAPHSTSILLRFGADPNIKSIASEVQNSLSPLHLVAGNYRGSSGVEKVDALFLLGKRLGEKYISVALTDSILQQQPANIFVKTAIEKELPLHIALKKKNFSVAERLWNATMKNIQSKKFLTLQQEKWDIGMSTLLAEAAIECTSVGLFQTAVNFMVSNYYSSNEDGSINNTTKSLERALGKLLLWAVDERSSFGCIRSSSKGKYCDNNDMISNDNDSKEEKLLSIVNIIAKVQNEQRNLNISYWARDEISGHTPLHLLLRNDRGLKLRRLLLTSLCKMMSSRGDIDSNPAPSTTDMSSSTLTSSSNKLLSLASSDKFGSYTALHFACALGCEESVGTLLEFGANSTLLCGESKRPHELIPNGVRFSEDIEQRLN